MGQVDLQVVLTAELEEDLDVQLYDMSANKEYEEGKAIVAWCDDAKAPSNVGIMNAASLETYGGMDVEYSGYSGANGNAGNEFIKIPLTTVPLSIAAYAFKTGQVKVDYSWRKTESACCAGTEASTTNCDLTGLGNQAGNGEGTYKGLTYTYSGYNGEGIGKKGNEFISISGVTNTKIMMKVFGYQVGTAEVVYEYYENVADN